jgi:hypothetical protein
MASRLGAIALIVVTSVTPAFAHEPIQLDSRHATLGLTIEIAELPSRSPSDVPRYRLHASGFPPGVVFGMWTKDFGHSFHEIVSGLAVAPSGALVSNTLGPERRLEEMMLSPGSYPPGAIWEVALVSVDRTLSAFTKVIPRPIRAQDGPCALSLELVSHRGERFLASGEGFTPGDDVLIESVVAGRVSQRRARVAADGRLRPDLLSHGAIGSDRRARYAIMDRGCAVAVEYEWGERALNRR